MALLEVNSKILKQDDENVRMRYYMDSAEQVHIHLWENESEDADRLIRFQLSWNGHMFQWKRGGQLNYARVEEDSFVMGIKKSPMVYMQNGVNPEILNRFLVYLREHSKQDRSLSELAKIFEKHGTLQESE